MWLFVAARWTSPSWRVPFQTLSLPSRTRSRKIATSSWTRSISCRQTGKRKQSFIKQIHSCKINAFLALEASSCTVWRARSRLTTRWRRDYRWLPNKRFLRYAELFSARTPTASSPTRAPMDSSATHSMKAILFILDFATSVVSWSRQFYFCLILMYVLPWMESSIPHDLMK